MRKAVSCIIAGTWGEGGSTRTHLVCDSDSSVTGGIYNICNRVNVILKSKKPGVEIDGPHKKGKTVYLCIFGLPDCALRRMPLFAPPWAPRDSNSNPYLMRRKNML